jgi:lysine 2,3-aminomutase
MNSAPFPPAGPPVPATLRDLDALVSVGLVTAAEAVALKPVTERYAIGLTPEMLALIDPADPADPIARQFVPTLAEGVTTAEERADPIGDDAHSPVPGVVHRYPDRALLKVVHACPVYCRFCFRREMVGPGGAALSGAGLERAIAYLEGTPTIREVILTGGDPFMLSARRAGDITARLAAIPHVDLIRWHTRVPVVDPSRVTAPFARALAADAVTTVVAIHANHPREFTPEAARAIRRLADAGVMLVSQSVLLRGVNDDVDTLAALMRAFLRHRIKPYLLHQGDLAPGTGHFRTRIAESQALMGQLRGRLSGLAQPTLVLDIPGGHGKVPIGPGYLSDDLSTVTDWRGVRHPVMG